MAESARRPRVLSAARARSWTKLWNNVPKRAAVVLVSGLVMMYAGIRWDYLGAAALVRWGQGQSHMCCPRPSASCPALGTAWGHEKPDEQSVKCMLL